MMSQTADAIINLRDLAETIRRSLDMMSANCDGNNLTIVAREAGRINGLSVAIAIESKRLEMEAFRRQDDELHRAQNSLPKSKNVK